MSTIPQGPLSTNNTVIDPQISQLQHKEQVTEVERISRGYPVENSVSRNVGQEKIDPPIKARHNLDVPAEGSDSPSEKVLKEISVFTEIQKHYKANPDTTELALLSELVAEKGGPELLGEALERPNPLASHINSLQSNKDQLISLGYSEEMVDGLLALADPEDPNNSLSNMHSFSAQISGRLNGDDSLMKLSDLYADTINRVGNLKGGPAELHTELQADLKAFTSTFLAPNKHMDVDAATQMLMSIQSKLQNNRLIFDQQNIKINQVEREQLAEKRMNKMLDSIEKAEKAKESGQISRIFGYIAVALMAIVVAVLFATGVGSPVAMGLMAAALALTVLMTVFWRNRRLDE